MKTIAVLALAFLGLGAIAHAQTDSLMKLKPQHPRLIVNDTTWQELRAKRLQSPTLDQLLTRMEREGRTLLAAPPLTRHLIGRRLLDISREAFKRISLWSLDYHITGDPQFKERAEQEMLTVSAFTDWNPSHFLDVGEMTAALAIGYDWLYDELPASSRTTIRQAIVEKGLKEGLDVNSPQNWWHVRDNNWNQVCLGGLALGALAVAEDEPQISSQILDQVRTYNPNGLKPYHPGGVYPEGPTYWAYGTTYEVLLLAGLESALGTDWGLGQDPGFVATADYPLEVTGPTGLTFNYSDGESVGRIEPTLFWFARRFDKPALLFFQHRYLSHYLAEKKSVKFNTSDNRFLPFLAIWANDLEDRTAPKRPLTWFREGINPLAIFRSSWSAPDALFLALKGGIASASHGHMDAGSFVLEAGGVRWAIDLDKQDYESLESKGIHLWDGAQNGGRWTVFRLNNFSHNTLSINGQLHRVDGRAEIVDFSGNGPVPHAVVDLSAVFAGQAEKVTRRFNLLPHEQVQIQDDLSGLKPNDLVRWAFVTGAQVTVEGNHATLREDGKVLRIDLTTPGGGKFDVIPADPPKDGFNAPNPGLSILIANVHAPETGQVRIETLIHLEKPPSSP